MKNNKHRGNVVPIVTPVTAAGQLDEAGLDKLIEFLLGAGTNGIFVMGTTGEGPSIPRSWRLKSVERTVAKVKGRALVYAGIGDTCLEDSVTAASEYFRA